MWRRMSGGYIYNHETRTWTKPELPPEIVLSDRELGWLAFLLWRIRKYRIGGIDDGHTDLG